MNKSKLTLSPSDVWETREVVFTPPIKLKAKKTYDILKLIKSYLKKQNSG